MYVPTAVTIEELSDVIDSLKIVLDKVNTLSERLITQKNRERLAIDIIDDFVMSRYKEKLSWITEYRNPEYTDWEDAIEDFENDIDDTEDQAQKEEMKKDLELLWWAIESFREIDKADGLWISYYL